MEEELVCINKFETTDMKGWMISNGLQHQQWIYANKSKSNYNRLFSTPFRKFCKQVFLPEGFPESVHSDYVPYQIWDTMQAFASTILGTLTTHSIMRGVGVGDSTATPLAAAITWILKDGTGMVGRILFAWWNGTELDAQCKKWRLFADVLNDVAMGIELVVPYFSSHATAVLCISSGMKSLVGVAGGATRAAITQHQALRNNLADVSAKDGSQETCVNLIASLVGVLILYFVNVRFLAVYYVVLVTVHINANYYAVRSLCFETFNENRLALVVKNFLIKGVILRPETINQLESLRFFQRPSKDLCGFDIEIGGSCDKYFQSLKANKKSASDVFEAFKETYEKPCNGGFLLMDVGARTIYVVLREDSTPSDIIQGYFEAFVSGMLKSLELKLRPDIVKEVDCSSGPLRLLYNARWREGNLVTDMSREWLALLEKGNDWKLDVHLLPVGPYRSFLGPK